jgi:N-acetyl-anhydromuramyl-L-alanine amidase AmpD
MNTKEFVIIHHSDIRQDGQPQLQRIENGHAARGFPISSMGWHVGYHYVVEEDGNIVQCRSLSDCGSHTDNCGSVSCGDISGVPRHMINYRSIGVCLEGKFPEDTPTPEQLYSLHSIVWNIQTLYGSRILLHRETKPTNCPGIDLRALYEKEHRFYLENDLLQKMNALKWSKGLRRSLLERAIARLTSFLFPSP